MLMRKPCRSLSARPTHIGMSACCSLDELRKPSFVEHRSRLPPPSQIAQASSGVRQRRLTTMSARTSQAGHRRFLQPPRSSSCGGCLSPHGLPGGPERCNPGRRARLPPSGSMHRWFPAVVPESPISVSKRRSNCRNLGGRRWVRTTGFSLVRRNTAPITPSSAR
jgi:hypothetical protein